MVNLGAVLGIKVGMDTSDADRGTRKINSLMDSITVKTKGLNVFFQRTGDLLVSLTKLGIGFGAALGGGLTGGLAASPQFKAFLAGLKGPFIRLTTFLGRTFKPVFDSILRIAKDFVDVLTTNQSVKQFFDTIVGGITDFINGISKKDINDFVTKFANLGSGVLAKLTQIETFLEKTLSIDINATPKTLAILAGAAYAFGNPVLGGFLSAAALGSQLQNTLGDPTEFNRKIFNQPFSSQPAGIGPSLGQQVYEQLGLPQSPVDFNLVIENRTGSNLGFKGSGNIGVDTAGG